MNKFLTILTVVALTFALAGPAGAGPTTISFLYADSFAGVDGPTSGWSTSDTIVNLGATNWSLLGGTASVSGHLNGTSSNLTHRGTRGLGIFGREDDEVDRRGTINDPYERINITFGIDHYVDYLEVRSLYTNDGWSPGIEKGTVEFYLDGSLVYTENLVAVQSTGDGVLAISYVTPKLVDKLVYYVPGGLGDTSSQSEFAVAKLNVTPIPAPGAILLGGIGVGLVGWLRRRRTL